MSVITDWFANHGQPMPVPGVVNSPSNHPMPRRTDQLSSGHPVSDAGPGGVRLWQQTTRAVPFAGMCTVSGAGPLASSIEDHQGRAQVQLLDQRAAANPTLAPQLGAREPSGNPHMSGGQPHEAPSGFGQAPGSTPQRPGGPAYRPSAIGGQRQPGYATGPGAAARRAPGE